MRSAWISKPLTRKSISLPSSRRQVAHHLAEALENALGGHHADAADVLLQLAAQQAQRPGAALVQQADRPRLPGEGRTWCSTRFR